MRLVPPLFLFTILFSCAAYAQNDVPSRAVTHVRGDVYTASENGRTTIFVVTQAGIVVVDPLNASFGQWLATELKTRFPDRSIKYVVYSRLDFDRIGGSGVFGGRPDIIAHETISSQLERTARHRLPLRYAAVDYNTNGMLEPDELNAAGLPDGMTRLDRNRDGHVSPEELWSETPGPLRTFTTRYRVVLGDKTIELLYLGPQRTGTTAVYIGDDRLMFGADLQVSDPFADSSMRTAEVAAWTHALAERDFDTVLTGTGATIPRTSIVALDEYVRTLVAAVARGIQRGRSAEQLQHDSAISSFAGTAYAINRNADIATLYKRTGVVVVDAYGTGLGDYVSVNRLTCLEGYTCTYGPQSGIGAGAGFGVSFSRWRVAAEMTSGMQLTRTMVSRGASSRDNSRESHFSILGGYRTGPAGRFNIAALGGFTFISVKQAFTTVSLSSKPQQYGFTTSRTGWTAGADISVPLGGRVGIFLPIRVTTTPDVSPRTGLDLRVGAAVDIALVRRVL